MADLTIVCYRGAHLRLAALAWPVTILFCGGFPLVSFVIAFRLTRSADLLDRDLLVERYGVIIRGLRTARLWFRTLQFLVSFVFAAETVLVRDAGSRLFAAILNFCLNIILVAALDPFLNAYHMALSYIVGLLSCGQILYFVHRENMQYFFIGLGVVLAAIAIATLLAVYRFGYHSTPTSTATVVPASSLLHSSSSSELVAQCVADKFSSPTQSLSDSLSSAPPAAALPAPHPGRPHARSEALPSSSLTLCIHDSFDGTNRARRVCPDPVELPNVDADPLFASNETLTAGRTASSRGKDVTGAVSPRNLSPVQRKVVVANNGAIHVVRRKDSRSRRASIVARSPTSSSPRQARRRSDALRSVVGSSPTRALVSPRSSSRTRGASELLQRATMRRTSQSPVRIVARRSSGSRSPHRAAFARRSSVADVAPSLPPGSLDAIINAEANTARSRFGMAPSDTPVSTGLNLSTSAVTLVGASHSSTNVREPVVRSKTQVDLAVLRSM